MNGNSLTWTFNRSNAGMLNAKTERTNRTYSLYQNTDGTFTMYFISEHKRTGKPYGYGYGVKYTSLGHALFAAEHLEFEAGREE